MNQPTVLVVDDDPAIRTLLQAVLQDDGFNVLVAEHGARALEIVQAHPPDAILLDLSMPVMDGRAFYARLRMVEPRPIPVVILSAIGAEQTRLELKAEGAVSKPFDIDEVIATLREVVEPG